MKSSRTNSSKEKSYEKLRKKRIWPSIVIFAGGLLWCPCLFMLFVQLFATYIAGMKIEQIYDDVSYSSQLLDNIMEKGCTVQQAVEELEPYITQGRDIYVVDKEENPIVKTGTSTPDFRVTYDISLNEDIKVIADSEENFIQEKGLHSMSAILVEAARETFEKDDMAAYDSTWFYSSILDQKIWLQMPSKNSEYLFYRKYSLQILRMDILYVCTFGVFTAILTFVPLLLMFINTIRVICTQRKMMKFLYQDIMTGGRNWLYFRNYSERILTRYRNRKRTYAIVSLHLEQYHNYCSCYGTKAGEELLEVMNGFLNARTNRHEIFARYEGADFGLLINCQGMNEQERYNDCQKRLRSLLAELTGLNTEQKLHFQAGIYIIHPISADNGRYYKVRKSIDINQIYNYASIARREAKLHEETRISFFNQHMLENQLWNQKVERDMEAALREEEFEVYLQPKYSPSDKKMVGAEALVRWNSRTEGFIPPNRFIPIFEENGFITQLDDYMVSKVAKLLSEWTIQGKKMVPVSVNISRAHFAQEGLAEHICQLVDAYGPSHELIELEVTESAFLDDKKMLIETVKQLKAYGFRVSMDDFGSGYSSLNSLMDIPFDVLKLDTEFFRGDNSSRGETIVCEIIRLAQKLGMHVVAEGVEKKEHVELLTELGCDMIQGYYFAKPMPVSEFEEKVEKDA